jgi:hypothetical protein
MSHRVASMIPVALVLSGCLAVGCGKQPPSPPPVPTAAAQSVHRDPVTGKFGPPPAGSAPAAPMPPQLSDSAAGLQEVRAPRGGWMVHLGGRFHNKVTAARTAAGVATNCDRATP